MRHVPAGLIGMVGWRRTRSSVKSDEFIQCWISHSKIYSLFGASWNIMLCVVWLRFTGESNNRCLRRFVLFLVCMWTCELLWNVPASKTKVSHEATDDFVGKSFSCISYTSSMNRSRLTCRNCSYHMNELNNNKPRLLFASSCWNILWLKVQLPSSMRQTTTSK